MRTSRPPNSVDNPIKTSHMLEENQTQIVNQLRAKAKAEELFRLTNADWSHPVTEPLSVSKQAVFEELATIIESLRAQ